MQRYFIGSGEVASRLISREEEFSWRDGRILDASGFLIHSRMIAPLKTLPEIAEAGNAILVAEGGLGKTFVLEEFQKSRPNDVALLYAAYHVGNLPGLKSAIEESANKKFLLIDGLDEAMELCPALIGILQQTKLQAHVVLTSRSIPQLNSFCLGLDWPLFSLLPYTRDDVRELCANEKKDFGLFMREIEGRGFGGFCAKPLGCRMLLSSFDGKRLMSKTSEELWRRALLRLCSENTSSKTRSLVKAHEAVNASTCWDIAVRAALVLKLSGRSVLTRISPMVSPDNSEVDFAQVFPDDIGKFNECLFRPLFSPIGQDQFRFSHSSFFDFMAAVGVVELIERSEWAKFVLSPEGIPYPQWEGVIPWLAARDESLLGHVKESRPDLLLGSDAVVSKIGEDEICRCILGNAEKIPKTIRGNPAIQARYYALATDRCAEIVEEALRKGRSEAALDTAIDIVRRCRHPAMVDSLVEFFRNGKKPLEFRIRAGYALCRLADERQRKKCRTVMSPGLPKELTGLLLRLLWPSHMSAKELIPLLDQERDGIFDAFESWLTEEFPASLDQLSESDTLALLEWAVVGIKKARYEDTFLQAAKLSVFLHCWQNASSDKQLELLAKGLESFAKAFISPFDNPSSFVWTTNQYGRDEYSSDIDRRRRMARFIVENETLSLEPVNGVWIRLLQYGDIDYILDEIKNRSRGKSRQRWALCLVRLAGGIELPKCADTWNWLHEEFPKAFPVDARSAMLERKKLERRIRSVKRLRNDRAADRGHRQSAIHSQNAKWVHESFRDGVASKRFVQIMSVVYSQTPQDGITDFCLDFRKSALWPTFSQKEIDALVSAAYDFILACNGPWSKEHEYHPSYLQAFYLLMAFDKDRLGRLPSAAWRKFAPELLQAHNLDKVDLVQQTLQFFADRQTDVFLDELSKRLTKQMISGRTAELYKFKSILNDDTRRRLLESLDSETLTNEQRCGLYEEFWGIDARQTAEYINRSRFSSISLKKCDIRISIFLLASAPEKRFPELLRALLTNRQWGREWTEQALGRNHDRYCSISSILSRLSVTELKEFYSWLLANYPPEKKPHHTGGYTPGLMDNVYTCISFVFNELVSRVDIALPAALEDLGSRFPRLVYLHDWALRSRQKLLEANCPTYDIQSIRWLLSSKGKGIVVETADDLLNAVYGVLTKNYQVYLTGKETPRVKDLWNEPRKGELCALHKDEETFSDHIKSYLELVLPKVAACREVQLNRGLGNDKGSKTDIWITAISQKEDRLKLCIEVKGHWNRTWRTAFQNQLCKKYMGAGGAAVGILLLGWFVSKKGSRSESQDNKNMAKAGRILATQERRLAKQGYKVRHVVLDCAYR